MSKKASLKSALNAGAQGKPAATAVPKYKRDNPSRYNTKGDLTKAHIAGFFDLRVRGQLKQIAVENELAENGQAKTIQDLLAEALNLLFKQYGKPPIAK